jgi:hypothetical protein
VILFAVHIELNLCDAIIYFLQLRMDFFYYRPVIEVEARPRTVDFYG